MALRPLEEKLARAEDGIGASAGLDLPGDAAGRVGFREKIDLQLGGRGAGRFARRAGIFP